MLGMQKGFCASARLTEVLGLSRPRALLSRRVSSYPVHAASASATMGLWRAVPGTTEEELSLEFTLPTGQSFRWRRVKAAEPTFDGVIGQRAVCLTEQAAVPWRACELDECRQASAHSEPPECGAVPPGPGCSRRAVLCARARG